jgi:Cu-Zn family superoxide dismutase
MTMRKFLVRFAAVGMTPLAIAGAHDGHPADGVEAAVVKADGTAIGTVRVREAPTGVLMVIETKGLVPGWHGMHFHQTGECSDGFKKAGGHILNTAAADHDHGGASATAPHLASGLLNDKANDAGALPNIHVAEDRTAAAEMLSTFVSMDGREGRPALLDGDGASLIIHEGPEDHTGSSDTVGKRVACAAIKTQMRKRP